MLAGQRLRRAALENDQIGERVPSRLRDGRRRPRRDRSLHQLLQQPSPSFRPRRTDAGPSLLSSVVTGGQCCLRGLVQASRTRVAHRGVRSFVVSDDRPPSRTTRTSSTGRNPLNLTQRVFKRVGPAL
jgi:hypothetical protein